MIKIQFENKPIFLCKDYKGLLQKNKMRGAFIAFDFSESKIKDYLDLLLFSDIQSIIVPGDELKHIRLFKRAIKNIIAGGGIVLNEKNECLFIFRKGKWDLPKGKLDLNEKIEDCALREVKEETGIHSLLLGKKFYTSYHIYIENQYILKETHWFLMNTSDIHFVPQKEEGISKVKWFPIEHLFSMKKKTYNTIFDIILKLQKGINEKNPSLQKGRLKKSHK